MAILHFSLWGLLVILAVSAALWQLQLVVNLDSCGENSVTESETLYALRNVRNGQALYHDFGRPPHVLTQYTPLFYYVPGIAARLLGAGEMQTYVIGRWYTYGAWLGVGFLIFGLGRQFGANARWSLLAALFWLSADLAPRWANSYRPDAMALCGSLMAIWLYQLAMARKWRWAIPAALVIAFLYKQSTIAAALALMTEAVATRCYKRAVGLMGALLVTAVVVLALGHWATGGVFETNVLFSLARLNLAALPWYFVMALVRGAPVFAGAAFESTIGVGGERIRLARNYFALALALAVVSSAKAGANLNYYLEPFAVACILTAVAGTEWQEAVGRRQWLMAAWVGLAFAWSLNGLAGQISRAPSLFHNIVHHRQERQRQQKGWDSVAAPLRHQPWPVLMEDPYLTLFMGETPYLMNAGNFGSMAETGSFDDQELRQRIVNKDFSVIVANFPLDEEVRGRAFPPRWREPMVEHYTLTQTVTVPALDKQFYFYRPKSGRDG